MNSRYVWFALGIGASLGAAAALLFAPQTGADTRKQLKDGFDDASDYVEDAVGDAGDYLKGQAQRLSAEAQKTIKDVVDKGTALAGDALDRSTEVAAVATKAAKKATNSMF